jgi:ABC-2 type transport system permease protein
MNWKHFRALVWLRRRLFRNRMRRAGKFNAIVTQILMVLAGVASVAMSFVALGLGVWLLPKASPDHVLYLWTGVVVAFLFFWMLGVMTELQRSEVLSIEKLFHFPISPSGAFVINYLSSLVCLSLILFLPAMIGLAIASVYAMGPWMLISLPLLFGFILMVTAITYQFRGWLATLMVNKRRRRTIMACITGSIILISQAPNLINLTYQGRRVRGPDNAALEYNRDFERLQAELNSHKISPKEFHERLEGLSEAQRRKNAEETQVLLTQLKRWVATADVVLPPGWLAYGTHRAAEHQIWPGIVGTLLLGVIAGASLRRSYRTTVRFYLGDFRSDQSTAQAPRLPMPVVPIPIEGLNRPAPGGLAAQPPSVGLVGGNVPWVPEQAAATGLATLRSLLRAPEVKMMLLTPTLLGVVMMTTRLASRKGVAPVPAEIRSVLGLAIVMTVVVSLSQVFQNQFGFDRSAFRIFVLSPASRRQILLGKNLAMAPIVGVAGLVFLGILEFMFPLRLSEFLATLVEMVSAFLIVCLVGNQMSILLPSAIRQGSMRSSDTKVLRVLLRFVAMLGLLVAFVPLAVPLGLDYLARQFLFEQFGWLDWVPIYLILSLLVAVVILLVYRTVLDYQGELLQRRELRILEAVTTRDD